MGRGLFCTALAVSLIAGAEPCLADAIVSIVNKGNFGVTVNLDGAYGCRAESAARPGDADAPNQCTFGAALGTHTLDLRFDNGESGQRTIVVPAKGYVLTLPGTQ